MLILRDTQWAVVFAMSSIFYVRGFTGSALAQPVIYITLFLLFISVTRPIINRLSLKIFAIAFSLSILLAIQQYLIGLKYGIINEFGRIVFPLLSSLLLANWYARYVENKCKFMATFLKAILFFLILDLIFRLVQNGKLFPTYSRYELKVGGLIYLDSNFSGFLSACLWIYSLENKIIKFKSITSILYCLLILYSFSLAVYIGLLGVFLYKAFSRNIILILISIPICSIVIWYVYMLVSEDGSFATKLEIGEFVFNYIAMSNPETVLIGLGSGNIIDYIGRASHTLIGVGIELGLFFTLITFFILYTLFWVEGLSALIVFISIVALAALFPIAYLSPVYCIVSIHLINVQSSRKLVKFVQKYEF